MKSLISLALIAGIAACSSGHVSNRANASDSYEAASNLSLNGTQLKTNQIVLVNQRGSNQASYIRAKVYDYAPTVMLDNGVYRMWWCGGIAGDFILHAEAGSLDGPWHGHTSAAPNSYDVALQPTGHAGDFDSVHTCDPSVVKANNTYYLYYGGLGNGVNAHDKTTAVGVASSSDGLRFNRLNGGKPIAEVARSPDGSYGAGQPSASFVNGQFFLMYTDSTARGANPVNRAGQFVLRSTDPTFQSGVDEVVGSTGFASRTAANHGTYSVVDAFSSDLMYIDVLDAFAIAHNNATDISTIDLFDRNLKALPSGNHTFSVKGAWTEGPALVTQPNKHALVVSDCTLIPVDLMRSVRDASGDTAPNGWDLAHDGADLKIQDFQCTPPAPPPPAPAPSSFIKHGNNGTVSCSTFCRGSQWGGKSGACSAARFSAPGQAISCNAVPGFVSAGELACTCDSFTKHGNNGTVSCGTFCSGSQWGGGTGTCRQATLTAAEQQIGCDETPGLINAGELTCTCR